MFRRHPTSQRNHQPDRLLITGVGSIVTFALRVHGKEQPMLTPQDQRLLLGLCRRGDVDCAAQVRHDLGVGRSVQIEDVASRTRDEGRIGDVGKVHVQGAIGAV